MKQRFSSLDLGAVCGEINERLEGTRLANIYDINSRTFLLKFAKQGEKHNVLIESGYRIHLTEYARETAAAPSNFCAKLRKHVRTRRITHVRQLGIDRVLIITFGGGEDHADPEKSFHIVLEFYAGGNVILTDGYFRILSLQRIVGEDEGQRIAVGEIYDTDKHSQKQLQRIDADRLRSTIETLKAGKPVEEQHEDEDVPLNALQVRKARTAKKKDKGAGSIKKALAAALMQYGGGLIEHCAIKAGLDPASPIADMSTSGPAFDELLKQLQLADDLLQSRDAKLPGFLISKTDGEHASLEDFQPFSPAQFESREGWSIEAVDTFNNCVDKYFSSIEAQKLEQRVRQQEQLAERRVQAAKDEQRKKIEGLVATQEQSAHKAAALEGNQGVVDEAINAINSLLEQGMDWIDMENLIKTEAGMGNPVAQVISLPLKIAQNTVTLRVQDPEDMYDYSSESSDDDETDDEESDSDEESEPKKYLLIDVDISKTAYANARSYYSIRRTAVSKEEKTQQAARKALRSIEQRIERDLKKGLNTSERSLMKPIRKAFWFEKFLWFISSEGYLVIGGHDAQQNEMLYRRHLRKGDIYVHADLHGAATVIIKNTAPDQPIPPSTISQAGTLSVATSGAWDAKTVISAWWVHHDQVSKTAPTGEYLTTGSFMVRGKKNFLPPAKLELGYGMFFLVDETSRDRHVKERSARLAENRHFDEPVDDASAPVDKATEATIVDADSQAELAEESIKEEDKSEPAPAESTPAEPADEDKYKLDDFGHSDAEADTKQFSGKAKHISAKERREARRQREGGAKPSALEDADSPEAVLAAIEQKAPDESQKATTKQSTAQAAPQSQQLTRGQKAKKKKLAKYQDQDEEDRVLAQKLLGIQLKKDDKATDTESETEAVADKPTKDTKPATAAKGGAKKPQKPHNAEVAQILKDENIATLDDDEADLVTPLDCLVGDPFPEDVLLDAVPTCAPYAALQKCKYRVKLQPGSTKKGKATKSCIAAWTTFPSAAIKFDETAQDREMAWPRERELIKSLKDNDIIGCVGVSKVKVTFPSGAGGGGGGGGKKGGSKSGRRK